MEFDTSSRARADSSDKNPGSSTCLNTPCPDACLAPHSRSEYRNQAEQSPQVEQHSLHSGPSPTLDTPNILPNTSDAVLSISTDNCVNAPHGDPSLVQRRGRAYHSSPTLAEYTRFHRMLIGPAAARRCIKSFTGCILLLPAHVCVDASKFQPSHLRGCSPYEVRFQLDLFVYYLFVLCSNTGLSSLLCRTKTVDASLPSATGPALALDGRELDPWIISYLARLSFELPLSLVHCTFSV